MIVGRVFVASLIAISVLWIPVVQYSQTGTLFVYIQMVSSYLQPPVAAIYLLGIFVDEVNEIGVFWSLVSALGLGFIRMGMDMKWQRPGCEDLLLGKSDPRPFLTKNFPYLYFSVFLFVYTCITCVVISRMFNLFSEHLPFPENVVIFTTSAKIAYFKGFLMNF